MLNINTLGFFSGGGGLDLGFSAAGFNIILSSDIDAHSCETLKLNQKKKVTLKSILYFVKMSEKLINKLLKASLVVNKLIL